MRPPLPPAPPPRADRVSDAFSRLPLPPAFPWQSRARAGKCWKALPRDERAVWEAKAVAALAAHRQKYPDWRFKPAANALAKVKDGPRKSRARKGRGQSEKEERSREKRCAKIADLIAAGKTGPDLAAAVKQYDCEVERGRKLRDGGAAAIAAAGSAGEVAEDVKVRAAAGAQAVPVVAEQPTQKSADVKAPGDAGDARFVVPLTAMFKRSSSAPASRARAPGSGFDVPPAACPRRESFSAPSTHDRAPAFDYGSGASLQKPLAREDTASALAGNVSSTRTSSTVGGSLGALCHDVSPNPIARLLARLFLWRCHF